MLAVVLLSEPLGSLQVAGGLLIAVGILLARGERPRHRRPRIGSMSEHDFMPIDGWDHLEIWVGNAKQSAYFYESAYGFTRTAYAGPETGVRDRASYVLEQGDIRFVLTSGLRGDSEICRWAQAKGDSVRDVALAVPDATNAYRQAVQRGARGVVEPHWVEDDHGRVELAAIATYGDNIHTFVNRSEYSGAYLPGYQSVSPNGGPARGVGLIAIDHVVGNVELGRMDEWVGLLRARPRLHAAHALLGRGHLDRVLRAHVEGHDGRRGEDQVPDQRAGGGRSEEPDRGVPRVPRRPGVQHVAMQSEDIVKTVAALREHGVLFIATPDTYYDIVQERVGEIEQSWDDLRSMGILADRDEEGYLLQLFTKIVQDRPTLFFEVIERHGSRGFGIGNFKSLFEAIEREQALRGNL